MATSYSKATTQHGHWLATVVAPSSASSATAFPRFLDLPLELQTQIWTYAAIAEQTLSFPAALNTASILQAESDVHWRRNNTAYFFPGQLQLSAPFLRGLKNVKIRRSGVYLTLFATLWRRLSISWQYDLSRSLAQTCRLARWVVLRDIRTSIAGIKGDDGAKRAISDIKGNLLGEIDGLIEDLSILVYLE